MTFPNPEWLILIAFLFVVGRYVLPAIGFVVALRGATTEQRTVILEQMNVFFRGRPRRTEQTPDEETPPKQITKPK